MIRRLLTALSLLVLLSPSVLAAPKDGWPDTPAGAMGRGWIAAFSTSDTAMREFNQKNLATESLAKKSLEERAVSYRKLHERYGKLLFGSVVKSQPSELSVNLIASDGSQQVWVFTVTKEAPHKLVSVGILERRSHFGGFHH